MDTIKIKPNHKVNKEWIVTPISCTVVGGYKKELNFSK